MVMFMWKRLVPFKFFPKSESFIPEDTTQKEGQYLPVYASPKEMGVYIPGSDVISFLTRLLGGVEKKKSNGIDDGSQLQSDFRRYQEEGGRTKD